MHKYDAAVMKPANDAQPLHKREHASVYAKLTFILLTIGATCGSKGRLHHSKDNRFALPSEHQRESDAEDTTGVVLHDSTSMHGQREVPLQQ